jgi:excisionase family DNA binding protein
MARRRDTLEQLKRALKAHRESLEALENALLTVLDDHHNRNGNELLSIREVCEELGMGKSWVYARLRSGDIPPVRLGRTFKVMRKDLEEYLEGQRHRQSEAEKL